MKLVATVLAVAWSLVCVALPSTARADGYQSVVDEGVREFAAGNFVEARSLFEQAHALQPNARTWRALGICAYELKRYVQATDELTAALDDPRTPLTADLAGAVRDTLARAQRFVGQLELETQPEDAHIVIDGEARSGRRFKLDAGEHVVVGSAAGYQARDLTVTIAGLQTRRAELVLTPLMAAQPSPRPAAPLADSSPSLSERWWFWTTLGVIVAGVAVGVVAVTASGGDSTDAGTTGVTLNSL